MKKVFLVLFFVIILFPIFLLGAFQKPQDAEFAGMQGRRDTDFTTPIEFAGSWVIQNIRYAANGDVDWANWKCGGVAQECQRGSWWTVWRAGFSLPGWPLDEDGNPEPPLPNEPGTWMKTYLGYCPMHYDPLTGLYY